MLQESNITKLYKYLQLGGKYTTKELSEKFVLTPRTIQGYLKKLKEEYGLKNEKKHYFFAENYRHIEESERVQMSTALMISLYKNALPLVHDSVLENFKEIPKQVDAFLFDIDFQSIENETYFNQITDAIINQKAIHFKYKNTQNETSIKNIFPLKNTNILGYWYLMGYDLESDKVKTFYFNNIQDLIVSKDESCLSTKKIEELSKLSQELYSPWFNNEQKTVQLKVRAEAMRYMQRRVSSAFKIVKTKKDTLLVDMYYYNDVEVLTFVQKWLPYIEIVDDKELRGKLHAVLNEYLSI